MTIPSRFVSLSTSTRNPIAPDSWIRQRALTSRTNSGSGGLPRPPRPAVREPVHGLQRDREQDVRPVARLDQLHQADRAESESSGSG